MILIGFMGSGKTTIAKALSDKLNIKSIDIDEEIINTYETTISRIFVEEGEAGFRKKEYAVLKQHIDKNINDNVVISTGGGVVTYENSLKSLKSQKNHNVYYLDAPFEVLYERIKGDSSRPLANQDEDKVKALFKDRQTLYHDAADYIIKTEQEIPEIIKEILKYEN